MEMLGALQVSRSGLGSPLYIGTATLEETLECLGVLVWNHTILDYAGARGYRVTVRFVHSPGNQQRR